MGMFDEIEVLYPLPGAPDGFEFDFQTKSLDCVMANFQIREDGSLWREHYGIEDRSDPNAKGIMRWAGAFTRVDKRWEPEPHTGEIRFYDVLGDEWFEYRAWFVGGQLRDVVRMDRGA